LPEHGGNLVAAIRRWGIPREDWLDLSTGINPRPWPLPPLPPAVVTRLPEPNDGLEAAAQQYYGVRTLLPVSGSQAAIRWLPRLRSPSQVGVISPAYTEHAYQWRLAGHAVHSLSVDEVDPRLSALDVLILVRPNNPDGRVVPKKQILAWWEALQQRDGWLIVDEAFVDAQPGLSLVEFAAQPGFIVLRSLGKFFGLAGLRLGFVLAESAILKALSRILGAWAVPGPTRYWGRLALADETWQQSTRIGLQAGSRRLEQLLRAYGLVPAGGTPFFQFLPIEDAPAFHEALAALGILTRCFSTCGNAGPALRIGLPATEMDWDRLEHGLRLLA